VNASSTRCSRDLAINFPLALIGSRGMIARSALVEGFDCDFFRRVASLRLKERAVTQRR
jgi:hypothetical protein